MVPAYMLANLACIGFFARHRKEEQHWLLHVVIPILDLLFLVPGFLSVARSRPFRMGASATAQCRSS